MVNPNAGWKEIPRGGKIIEAGNAREYETGSWRAMKPVVDREKCIDCLQCWVFCPDMAYSQTEDGYFVADMEYCKGCGICAHECPKDAITMHPEEE